MSIFSFFKKKEYREEKDSYVVDNEPEFIEEETLESMDFQNLTHKDKTEYIKDLEENIKELHGNTAQLKEEYKMASSYLSDIQLIDTMPEEDHKKMVDLAKQIQTLTVDRKIYQTTESKISNARYMSIQYREQEIKTAVKDMANNEKHLQMISRDMKIIAGEKFGLREDAKKLARTQNMVNHVTLITFLLLITIFAVYLLGGLIKPEMINDTVFLVLMLIALILVTAAFLVAQKVKNEIHMTQLKLNKAIALHNKIKIKFVNATNTVEYQKAKYDVENAYQLSRLYELYLETKRENEIYMRTASELNDSMEKLMQMLTDLDLYDPQIWQNEIRALIDKREMVEVRHRLNQRRQKLREQMEANDKKISEIEFMLKIYRVE